MSPFRWNCCTKTAKANSFQPSSSGSGKLFFFVWRQTKKRRVILFCVTFPKISFFFLPIKKENGEKEFRASNFRCCCSSPPCPSPFFVFAKWIENTDQTTITKSVMAAVIGHCGSNDDEYSQLPENTLTSRDFVGFQRHRSDLMDEFWIFILFSKSPHLFLF